MEREAEIIVNELEVFDSLVTGELDYFSDKEKEPIIKAFGQVGIDNKIARERVSSLKEIDRPPFYLYIETSDQKKFFIQGPSYKTDSSLSSKNDNTQYLRSFVPLAQELSYSNIGEKTSEGIIECRIEFIPVRLSKMNCDGLNFYAQIKERKEKGFSLKKVFGRNEILNNNSGGIDYHSIIPKEDAFFSTHGVQDKDQNEYLISPIDEVILLTGPPGSGKSFILLLKYLYVKEYSDINNQDNIIGFLLPSWQLEGQYLEYFKQRKEKVPSLIDQNILHSKTKELIKNYIGYRFLVKPSKENSLEGSFIDTPQMFFDKMIHLTEKVLTNEFRKELIDIENFIKINKYFIKHQEADDIMKYLSEQNQKLLLEENYNIKFILNYRNLVYENLNKLQIARFASNLQSVQLIKENSIFSNLSSLLKRCFDLILLPNIFRNEMKSIKSQIELNPLEFSFMNAYFHSIFLSSFKYFKDIDLNDYEKRFDVKHLVVDEFTELNEYDVCFLNEMRQFFNFGITYSGDFAQSFRKFGLKNPKQIHGLNRTIELRKIYRYNENYFQILEALSGKKSAWEGLEFATYTKPWKPKYFKLNSVEDSIEVFIKELNSFRVEHNADYTSAVITDRIGEYENILKDEEFASQFFNMEFEIIDKNRKMPKYHKSFLIYSLDSIQGLEFDLVFLDLSKEDNTKNLTDFKALMYLSFSRARHYLLLSTRDSILRKMNLNQTYFDTIGD